MSKKCNCKAKENVNNLIKSVDDINKSSSKNHISKKNTKINIIVKIIKIIFYTFALLFLIVGIIPIIIYASISKKPITLKIPFINKKNGIK
jgi:hypothetical protein